jgi:hypothetical protein
MATHFYCGTDGDLLKRKDFRSMKSLMGSRLGSALLQPDVLLEQSEGVSPVVSENGETPALGRSPRLL